ncbi:MAG TPA: hypothetical protein PLP42_19650 [Acidobacteriota bacterium]|nr:hypothetical protein [Acidobacteriota bacterium]
MKTLIIAVALSMIAGQVFATGKDHHGNHGNNNGPKNGGSTANSSSASGAFSAAGAVAGAASISGATGGTSSASGGQGGAGGSAAGGTAVASVGAMSFNFTSPAGSTGSNGTSTSFVQHDYSGVPNNTPAMGNSYISTSNSCDGAVGASLVLPGFGGSVSAATLRMMCEGRLNSQAHKALGQEDKARLTMEVVQEYACEEDAKWAKIARKKGLCAPADEAAAVAQTNPAFNSK